VAPRQHLVHRLACNHILPFKAAFPTLTGGLYVLLDWRSIFGDDAVHCRCLSLPTSTDALPWQPRSTATCAFLFAMAFHLGLVQKETLHAPRVQGAPRSGRQRTGWLRELRLPGRHALEVHHLQVPWECISPASAHKCITCKCSSMSAQFQVRRSCDSNPGPTNLSLEAVM